MEPHTLDVASWHPLHSLPEGAALTAATEPRLAVFHPTHATFKDHHGNHYKWTSRDHRKGRYPHLKSTPYHRARAPPLYLLPIWPTYDFSDISYWVGLIFTLGCVAWVVNGHFALWPDGSNASSKEQAKTIAAAAAFVGGTLFEVGSWLLYWEALNAEQHIDTGTQVAPGSSSSSCSSPGSKEEEGHVEPAAAIQQHMSSELAQRSQPAQLQQHGQDHESVMVVQCLHAPRYCRRCVSGSRHQTNSDRFHLLIADRLEGQPSKAGAAGGQLQQQQQQVQWAPMEKTRDTHNGRDSNGSSSQTTRQGAYVPAMQPRNGKPGSNHTTVTAPDGGAGATQPTSSGSRSTAGQHGNARWRWFGFRWRDLGFLASFLQLVGATIFWVPCIFAIPGLVAEETLSNVAVWNGLYWLLQVVGASFFIISSLLFMVEVQPAWYHPALGSIGWHVGFWNLIGSIGFWLSGFFGFWAVPSGKYQLGGTVLSTFWGSYAFLIGSYLQLTEALNKHNKRLPAFCRT